MKHISIIKQLLVCSLLCVGVASCSRVNSTSKETFLSVDLTASLKDSVKIELSEFLVSINYVQLDSHPTAYCNVVKNISENYITAIDKNENIVKLFDKKTGKYLCKVGDKGNGRGEYIDIAYMLISKDEKNIYIQSQKKREEIMVYGIDELISTIDQDGNIVVMYGELRNQKKI